MNIFVIGAGGYLGSSLLKLIEFNNYKLSGLSSNIIEQHPNIAYYNYLENPKLLKKYIPKNLDVLINVAGADYNFSNKYPDIARKITVDYAIQTALISKESNIKLYIYISTAHVYGEMKNYITEESKLNPTSVYSRLKIETENKLIDILDNKLSILRLSNVFGEPKINNKNCMSLLAHNISYQAISNKKIILESSGNQSRNFLTIYDFKRVIMYLIKNRIAGIHNIGGNLNCKVLDFIKRFKNIYEDYSCKKITILINNRYPLSDNTKFYYSNEKFLNYGFEYSNDYDRTIFEMIKALEKL